MNAPNVQTPQQQAAGVQRPKPLRIVKGPDGKPRVVRRGIAAFAALQANIPKVLRIGVIQGARIVEERIVRKRETVFVGPNEKNHFIVPNPNLPPRHPLFELRPGTAGEQYFLTVLPDMNGRVAFPADQGGVVDFASLRSSGRAVQTPKGWQVALNDQCRGKVVVGDTTMLFQFVVPPPVQPPPQLPASVRGGWLERMEGPFTACAAVSLVLHVGMMVGALVPEWPKPTLEDILASEYAQLPIPVPEAEKPPEDETTGDEKATDATGDADAAAAAAAAADAAAAAAAAEAPKVEGPRRGPEEPKVTVGGMQISQRQYDAQQAKIQQGLSMENILGGGTTGPSMGISTAFGGSSATVGNLQGALQGTAGTDDGGTGGYTTMGGALGSGPAVGGLGSGTGPAVAAVVPTHGDATKVSPGQTEIKRGKVRTTGPAKAGGTGLMNRDVFMGVFRRKVSGIEQCYNNALVRDPTLAGDLTFLVVINMQGGVSVEIDQGSPALDASGVTDCIERKLASMNFATNPPEGGDFRVRLPFSFIAP